MDLVRTLPFREGDTVRCVSMDPGYNSASMLLIGDTHEILSIKYALPRGAMTGQAGRVQWLYLTFNRGRWKYEAKHFELVSRPQNDNDVFDCIQDFIKTVPKKGKVCHQAITDQNRNSTS